MTDKQILGGRGSAKPYTTLNTIEVMLENERLESELNKYKQVLTEIKKIVETCNSGIFCSECPYAEECRTDIEAEALGVCKLILQKCEVLDE